MPTWASTGVIAKESPSGDVVGQLVHPLGTLKVSQKIVPLSHTLTRFGADEPIGHIRFEIVSINGITPPNLVLTTEPFAPAQFTKYR